LVELLRIAEEHDTVSRPGDRHDVGKRDLARLIDKEDIDGADHLRRRPEPGCPGGEIRAAVLEPGADIAGVLAARNSFVVDDLLLVPALDRPDP